MGTASLEGIRGDTGTRKLLVVEDHDVIVAGLHSALLDIAGLLDISRTPGRCQLTCVKSLPAALDALTGDFDLILLDLCPAADSSDALLGLKLLRQHFPDVPVALFSEDDSPLLIRDALQAGAAGFIPKRMETATIVAVVEFILKGGVYLPPHVVTMLGREPHQVPGMNAHFSGRLVAGRALTPRQQSVLELLLEGHSNKEIARVLGLTLGTIKNYVSELLKTTNTRTRSQVLAMMRMQPEVLRSEAEDREARAN